jgi:Phage capsid protein
MATDINLSGPTLNTTRGQQFIPELWLNEIQMFRKARQLDQSIVKTWMSDVKKGDTFHIPKITELAVEDKASDTGVSLQSNNDTDFVITVDTDRTTSVGIDVLLDAQSQYELRSPYMKAMGYALAKDFTASILGLRAAINNTAAFNVFSSSNGLITGNGTPFNYASFLAARRILLENDVEDGDDATGLCLIISPGQESAIMTIPQFISVDFITNRPVKTGMIGTLMGVDIIRTSLIGNNSLTGWKNGFLGAPEPTPGVAGSRYLPKQDAFTTLPLTFTGNAAAVHTAIMCHPEWAGAVASLKPKVTESFENREQIHLMVGRQAYGARLYRPGHAVNIHTTGLTV